MKKGPHPDKALTAMAVKNLKKPGKYADGNGLYLVITNTGAKKWIWRSIINGKRRELGVGGAKVSLAEAREKAEELARSRRRNEDILGQRRKTKLKIPTFKEAAKSVHASHKPNWKNPKHADQWINSLTEYVFPLIGERPVNDLEPKDVLAVLSPIWLSKPETARRVRQRIRAVFDWCKASGYRAGDNPVDGVGKVLPKHKDQPDHHAALHYDEVPSFIARLRNTSGSAALALEFLILTATRTTETLHAKWEEIDVARKVWTIPKDRMKANKEHRVPLSPRCIEIIKQANALSDGGDYVFPGMREGAPLSNMALLQVLKRMEVTATVHGFRSSFRDWAAECTNYPRDVAESALAHTVKDKAEKAYKRTDLFDKRRALMVEWTNFVTKQKKQKRAASATSRHHD